MQTHHHRIKDGVSTPLRPLLASVSALESASQRVADLPANATSHDAAQAYKLLANALLDVQAFVFDPRCRRRLEQVQATMCQQYNVYAGN